MSKEVGDFLKKEKLTDVWDFLYTPQIRRLLIRFSEDQITSLEARIKELEEEKVKSESLIAKQQFEIELFKEIFEENNKLHLNLKRKQR